MFEDMITLRTIFTCHGSHVARRPQRILSEYCDHLQTHIDALKEALIDVLTTDAPDPETDDSDTEEDAEEENGDGEGAEEADDAVSTDRHGKPRRLRGGGRR